MQKNKKKNTSTARIPWEQHFDENELSMLFIVGSTKERKVDTILGIKKKMDE